METINFINLTAGLEWLPWIQNPRFVRIQSTALEQKRWGHVIVSLGAEFLYNLAIGNDCVVYDCGARKPISRSIYQGIPWIRFAAQRAWELPASKPIVRGNNCEKYFEQNYRELEHSVKVELKAYRKYVVRCMDDKIYLRGICRPVGEVAMDQPVYWDLERKICVPRQNQSQTHIPLGTVKRIIDRKTLLINL